MNFEFKLINFVLVNEESDDDEGYNSITGTTEAEVTNRRRRKKPREEELIIVEENTKEELKEKFILLRESFDHLKGGYGIKSGGLSQHFGRDLKIIRKLS